MLHIIYKRVSRWNEARYKQIYNKDLAIALLREEYQEYLNAKDDVARLDALCDIAYVALGVAWKLDISAVTLSDKEESAAALGRDLINQIGMPPIYFMASLLDIYTYLEDVDLAYLIQCFVTLSLQQMVWLGLNAEEILKALKAVCDSNDTKVVVKTNSTVKAMHKGDNYVAPTAILTQIIDQVKARNGYEH